MKRLLKSVLARGFCRRKRPQVVQEASTASFIVTILFFSTVGLCLPAHGAGPPPSASEEQGAWSPQSLLVLPFEIGAKDQEAGTEVRSPVSGAVFEAGLIETGADAYLTQELMAWLRERTRCTLIPYGMAMGVRSAILSEGLGISDYDLLVETGRRLGADAVLSGAIYRFQRRIGTGYSVDTPASVAFGINLISVADGRLRWVGHFDETQRSLSHNLFKLPTFLRRGGGWLTAQELARAGLRETMPSSPLH